MSEFDKFIITMSAPFIILGVYLIITMLIHEYKLAHGWGWTLGKGYYRKSGKLKYYKTLASICFRH